MIKLNHQLKKLNLFYNTRKSRDLQQVKFDLTNLTLMMKFNHQYKTINLFYDTSKSIDFYKIKINNKIQSLKR